MIINKSRRLFLCLLIVFVTISLFPVKSIFAYDIPVRQYTVTPNPRWEASFGTKGYPYIRLFLTAYGFNKTHNFSKTLKVSHSIYRFNNCNYYRLHVELPDDGSKWEVHFNGFVLEFMEQSDTTWYFRDATTYSYMTTIQAPLDPNFPGYPSALVAAEAAKTAAQNAQIAANNAKTEAINAKNISADILSHVTNSTHGLSAINNSINNISTEVSNISTNLSSDIKSFISPEIRKISGDKGATVTRSSTFDVLVQASSAHEFRVKTEDGTWSSWMPINSKAVATGLNYGANTLYVEARNHFNLDNIATGQIIVFRVP